MQDHTFTYPYTLQTPPFELHCVPPFSTYELEQDMRKYFSIKYTLPPAHRGGLLEVESQLFLGALRVMSESFAFAA